MGWGGVADKAMAFVKWLWQNKFTIFFMITTVVFLGMYGCEKSTTKDLTEQLTVEKANVAQCTANYNTVVSTNNETIKGLNLCQK